jgi:gamma-glutamyltranspeptidase/glutathione hydrolase
MATRYAPNGMVCSVDHLASSAGVAVLRAGGSAADAAVAASAVLAVTSPHLCGMGGDLFALVHVPGERVPATLNASGRAGSGADPERLRAEGHTTMPFRGDVRSAPVPGCVDGWLELHRAHGRLPLGDVLGPAIGYAADGFPASPLLAAVAPMLDSVAGADDLRGDGQLRAGDRVRRPGVALALAAIVEHGRAGFYEGAFGEGLLLLGGGEYTTDDLERPSADWVEPLVATAWGHDLWTVPPNSQGYLTLLGARIAAGLDLPASTADPRWPHLLVEAARAAGHDRPAVLHEGADVRPLLADDAVAERAALVDPDRRSTLPTPVADGGTMHLCAADANGSAVSLIQSNASGFGSLVFEPATGIGLHNRGLGFSLVPGHPAEYGPGRRPPHTLSPAMVTRPDGSLAAAVGTMGGDQQPQILLQVLCRWLHEGESPGRAISAPRWALHADSGFDTWATPDPALQVEHDAPDSWADGLRARGHRVAVAPPEAAHAFGHAHLLAAHAGGGWAGAADPRAMVEAAAGY